MHGLNFNPKFLEISHNTCFIVCNLNFGKRAHRFDLFSYKSSKYRETARLVKTAYSTVSQQIISHSEVALYGCNPAAFFLVAYKRIIETEMMTFSYSGEGILIVYFTLVISSLDKPELIWH